MHRVSIEWEAAYAVRYKIEFHRSGRWDVSSDSGCDGFSSTSSACLAPSADEKQNGRWWRHHQYYEGVPADRVRIVLLERSMPPLVWLSSWLFNTYGYSMYSLVVEASACSSTAGTPLGATGSWQRLTSLPPGDKRTYTYHKGIEASQLEEREEGWSKEATTRMEHSFQVARGLPGVPMAELLNAAGGTMEVSSTLKREQSTRFAHELQRSTWEEVEDEISAHGILWQWVITFSDACGAVVLRTDELRITDTAQHPPCCLPGYETQGTGAPLGPCIAGTPNMCSDVEPSLAVDETGGTPRQHLLRFNADLAASRRGACHRPTSCCLRWRLQYCRSHPCLQDRRGVAMTTGGYRCSERRHCPTASRPRSHPAGCARGPVGSSSSAGKKLFTKTTKLELLRVAFARVRPCEEPWFHVSTCSVSTYAIIASIALS